ncbi:baseplate J/gp47 family protein [uncultured Deefgea sp.]|uniref:baseplate J/gp47 family protein n=1 Tax=uncultured Deefgea sp. TaxID=1304914 RepID=UPI00260A71E8|nr:baseplate J/gp47 family protein [uncultured Deefgea sp.]
MARDIPSIAAIEAALLRDVLNKTGPLRPSRISDLQVRAAGTASAIEGLYEHQEWIVQQIFPDTADTDMLERHCAVRKITRKAAVSAGGTVAATGQAGLTIPTGLTLQHADGRAYRSTAPALINGAGLATVSVSAVLAGEAGSMVAGQALTWQSPPLGVAGNATSNEITGGTDLEADDSMLARLLDLIQRPPAGGNQYDFKRWALEVPGVTAAYVYPLRRGFGTVDVVITANGGLPSPEVLASTQSHIDDERPVTAKNTAVITPTLSAIALDLKIKPVVGFTLAALDPKIRAVITAYFAALQPGDHMVVNKLLGQLTTLPGVSDAKITSPAANVLAIVDANQVQWLRQGAVAIGLLP